METIFKYLNIRFLDNEAIGKQTELLVINNPDGSPRWICNAKSRRPLFLNFFLISSIKSKLFASAIKLIFFLRLQTIVFTTQKVNYEFFGHKNAYLFDPSKTNWALFTGTVGPNNKILLFNETPEGNSFYKIAFSQKALSLLRNEESAIKMITSLKPKSFNFPSTTVIKNNVLKLNDLSHLGERGSRFSEKHQSALNEIYKKTSMTLEMDCLPVFQEMENKLKDLEFSKDNRIPSGLVRKLRKMQVHINKPLVDVGFSHGDFTPWNMYEGKHNLSIYDWELSNALMPIGFDAFHYILQQGILVDRKSWTEISKEIKDKITPGLFSTWTSQKQATVSDYLRYYLLINTVSSLHLYTKQPVWHTQVQWLINTWSQAVSESLQQIKTQRELIIMDVFDFLQKKKYAAIKFPNSAPEMLSEYSDIDLCINRNDTKDILELLKKHPLTKHIQTNRKSFMSSVLVFLKDGGVLSLDLIWKFKRKSLVILDAKHVIENVWRNKYGVMQMRGSDQARYIGLFYALNNAEIPSRFHSGFLLLKNTNSALDDLLIHYQQGNKSVISEINHLLKKRVENKNRKRLANVFNYFLDSCRSVLFSKGMIITFSGVDGSGKSTVIENVKHEIEKKIRKRVIVLRHRPSLLPILSAWTMGKDKAEQNAAKTLPRQGQNYSIISSILRFSYYYTDYLFGQFYVFLKYKMRGNIVLYDRYFFDFINDGERSNIRLPKYIMRFAYKFLLKPDLNFFLYAEPEVILLRKQELDKPTIKFLTNNYLNLFQQLNNPSNESYISIKNNELRTTIDLIINKTISKVA